VDLLELLKQCIKNSIFFDFKFGVNTKQPDQYGLDFEISLADQGNLSIEQDPYYSKKTNFITQYLIC
jgi:hypothetical protein